MWLVKKCRQVTAGGYNMRRISVINEKGGVGKTSVALNLAYGLAKQKRVLLVDLDPQHNLSSKFVDDIEEKEANKLLHFMESKKDIEYHADFLKAKNDFEEMLKYSVEEERLLSISDVLLNPACVKDAVIQTKYENICLLPASHELSIVENRLKNETNRDGRLRKALNIVRDDFDYVIIDNSPFESALTYNSICACYANKDMVLIPAKLDYESFQGICQTMKSIIGCIEDYNLDCDIRIITNMVTRTRLASIGYSALKKLFDERVFDTKIRSQASPIEKSSFGSDILLASNKKEVKDSGVYQDYQQFIQEFIEKEEC